MTSSIGRYTYTVLALAIERMRELVSTSLLLSKILTFIFLSLCCYFSKSYTSVALPVWLDIYTAVRQCTRFPPLFSNINSTAQLLLRTF